MTRERVPLWAWLSSTARVPVPLQLGCETVHGAPGVAPVANDSKSSHTVAPHGPVGAASEPVAVSLVAASPETPSGGDGDEPAAGGEPHPAARHAARSSRARVMRRR